jgi:hypothetical protein
MPLAGNKPQAVSARNPHAPPLAAQSLAALQVTVLGVSLLQMPAARLFWPFKCIRQAS